MTTENDATEIQLTQDELKIVIEAFRKARKIKGGIVQARWIQGKLRLWVSSETHYFHIKD